jgi:hypothetical protein
MVLHYRVASWYSFIQKIPIWVCYFGGPWNGKCWYMYVFYGHLEYFLAMRYTYFLPLGYFVVIWYIFLRFGILYQEKSGNPGVQQEI